MKKGRVTRDISALIKKEEAVSPARLSNFNEIIAATEDPGNATNKTNFVTSSEDNPIACAIPSMISG